MFADTVFLLGTVEICSCLSCGGGGGRENPNIKVVLFYNKEIIYYVQWKLGSLWDCQVNATIVQILSLSIYNIEPFLSKVGPAKTYKKLYCTYMTFIGWVLTLYIHKDI